MALGSSLGGEVEFDFAGGRAEPVLGTRLGGFFRLVGLAAFRAFKYKPQALQMVAPWGDLLQRGVRVVPQLLRKR